MSYVLPTEPVTAGSPLEIPPQARLAAELDGLFQVDGVRVRGRDAKEIDFSGRYLAGEGGYDQIARRFRSHGYTPLLSHRKGQDRLLAFKGLVEQEKTGKPWINLLLLVVTILTTLSAGAAMRGQSGIFAAMLSGRPGEAVQAMIAGAPFAGTLLGILGVHELGHYVAARWHRVPATLPYFIPLPIGGLGTLGAFISVRAPMKNRTVLFDIGLAGPLAGFVVALPLLILGLVLSTAVPFYTSGLTLRMLGSSVLIDGIVDLFMDLSPGQTLALHPVAFAAWFGILITGFNLLPLGQLDGGHVAYGLLGEYAHHVARGTFLLLIVAGFALSTTWLLWAFFTLFGGLHHPPPLNDLSRLDRRRYLIGLLTAALFFLIITPVPFQR